MQRLLTLDSTDGRYWADLGRAYIALNEPQKSYSAFQQTLFYLANPKDPQVWYGIGLLYELFGSEEHAEEAYLSMLTMPQTNEETTKCYYRLGMLYARRKESLQLAVDCFRYLLSCCDSDSGTHGNLGEVGVRNTLFQLASVLEKKDELQQARSIAEYLLNGSPNTIACSDASTDAVSSFKGDHVKDASANCLLGWIICRELDQMRGSDHQDEPGSERLAESAVAILLNAVEMDSHNAQSWYLLGRLYAVRKSHQKAYDAYQQAIYRDGKQPSYWCSIGILYFQIGQYKDALDGYIRAIHLNGKLWTVWANLGILYEHCANQKADAIDAYSKALEIQHVRGNIFELEGDVTAIRDRLYFLKTSSGHSSVTGGVPRPMELHPMTDYTTLMGSHQQSLGTLTSPMNIKKGFLQNGVLPGSSGTLNKPQQSVVGMRKLPITGNTGPTMNVLAASGNGNVTTNANITLDEASTIDLLASFATLG